MSLRTNLFSNVCLTTHPGCVCQVLLADKYFACPLFHLPTHHGTQWNCNYKNTQQKLQPKLSFANNFYFSKHSQYSIAILHCIGTSFSDTRIEIWSFLSTPVTDRAGQLAISRLKSWHAFTRAQIKLYIRTHVPIRTRLNTCSMYTVLVRRSAIRAAWEKYSFSGSSFSSVSQSRRRLLSNKMAALPGSSLITDQPLDALARVLFLLSSVVQTPHCSVLATVWPTTVKLKLQNLDHAHTLHTTILLLLTMSSIFSYQVMYLCLMISCVDHLIVKAHCVESVKMAMALHYTHTLWNAVSAGDKVMDGSCTFFSNSFQ